MAPMQILTFTTLYPNEARPEHGIFVETRLRQLVQSGSVDARVVAPTPWFPLASPLFGRYATFARIPRRENRHGLVIDHPRYPLLPKLGMTSAPLAMFAAMLPQLRRQMRNGRDFDLIDAHYFYPDGVAAVLLGWALDRPVVVTARGDDLDLISRYALPRQWICWAADRAAGLITVSNGLKRQLVRLGTAADRIHMLRNGVDLDFFRPLERRTARQALGFTRPTLLAVSNLVAKKRHQLMVEALALLPEVDLVIVGDGPERGAVEALARSRGVAERVRLLGHCSQERLPELYSAADLLLHPSSREGWPNVLLESMACGTPVIVADIDGMADIVAAPEAGLILTETTPAGLVHAVRGLLKAPPSRVATRAYAEQFDWGSTTQGQIDLFEQVAAQYRRHKSVKINSGALPGLRRGADRTSE